MATVQKGYSQRNSQQQGQSQGELITGQQQLNEAKAKLDRMKGEIQKIAGSLVSPDELVRFTLNACVKNPKLFECFNTAEGTASVFLSIITSRIIEIPCDGIHGYLVPYRQSAWENRPAAMICQFIPGYKGYVQLAYANTNIASVNCAAVFEKDDFDFEYGTRPYLRHKPTNSDSGPLAWSYAILNTRSGHTEFRVMTAADVLKRKNVSKAKDSGPWVDWEPEMWAKTAFLSLAKVAPMGNKVARAAAVDDRIQTHGNLTTDQLRSLKNDQPAALGYEKPEAAFESNGGDQREPEHEPARGQQQQRDEPQTEQRHEEPAEPVTAMSFLARIEDAVNATALKTILADATKALQQEQIEQHEHDQIASMAQEAKARLGK